MEKKKVRIQDFSRQPRLEDFREKEDIPEARPPLRLGDVRVRLSSTRTQVEIRHHIISELGKGYVRNLAEQCFGAGVVALWVKTQDGHSLWSNGVDGMILTLPPIPANEHNVSNAASRLGFLIKEAYKLADSPP